MVIGSKLYQAVLGQCCRRRGSAEALLWEPPSKKGEEESARALCLSDVNSSMMWSVWGQSFKEQGWEQLGVLHLQGFKLINGPQVPAVVSQGMKGRQGLNG